MKSSIFVLLMMAGAPAFSQSSTANISYDKSNKTGLMLSVPFDEKVAEGTILQKLKETGFNPETKGSLFWKQNKVNDFYVYKGVALNGMNGEKLDLYFKVESSGKKSAQQSVIYLLVSKGNEEFVSNESSPGIFSAAKTFLDNFTTETANYKHTLDVQAQEDVVKKAEKKLNGLQDDERDMIRKLQKLQEDLKKNKEDQESQTKLLEAERKKLDDLKFKKTL